MKKQNGITLIALVITIIVLLILAGITIAMISGQDSAPAKAVEARNANKVGAAKDAAALLVTDYMEQYYNGKYVGNEAAAKNATDVGVYINTKLGAAVTKGEYVFQVENGIFKVKDTSGNEIVTGTINSNGTITWSGEATNSGNSGNNSTGIATTNIKVGNNTIDLSTLDETTVAQYYGTTVATINGVNYGLFYVDYDGDYGAAGSIYLRAKSSVESVSLSSPSLSSAALKIMQDLNPQWNTARGTATTLTSGEQAAQHLCNPAVETWSGIQTAFGNKYGASNVNYVIGAPSIELYLASYNAKFPNELVTYSAHLNLNEALYSGFTYPGYIYSSDDGTSYSGAYACAISEDNAEGGMYLNTSSIEWIASPASYSTDDNVDYITTIGNLSYDYASCNYGVAPLVSLKPGVDLTIE